MFLFFFAIVVYSISCSTDADCVSFNDPLNRCEVPFCRFSVCSVRLLNDNQCPGACCMANGACGDDDMKDEPWCVADGGVFQGVSTFCSNVTCPQCDACPTLQNTAVSSPTFTTANNEPQQLSYEFALMFPARPAGCPVFRYQVSVSILYSVVDVIDHSPGFDLSDVLAPLSGLNPSVVTRDDETVVTFDAPATSVLLDDVIVFVDLATTTTENPLLRVTSGFVGVPTPCEVFEMQIDGAECPCPSFVAIDIVDGDAIDMPSLPDDHFVVLATVEYPQSTPGTFPDFCSSIPLNDALNFGTTATAMEIDVTRTGALNGQFSVDLSNAADTGEPGAAVSIPTLAPGDGNASITAVFELFNATETLLDVRYSRDNASLCTEEQFDIVTGPCEVLDVVASNGTSVNKSCTFPGQYTVAYDLDLVFPAIQPGCSQSILEARLVSPLGGEVISFTHQVNGTNTGVSIADDSADDATVFEISGSASGTVSVTLLADIDDNVSSVEVEYVLLGQNNASDTVLATFVLDLSPVQPCAAGIDCGPNDFAVVTRAQDCDDSNAQMVYTLEVTVPFLGVNCSPLPVLTTLTRSGVRQEAYFVQGVSPTNLWIIFDPLGNNAMPDPAADFYVTFDNDEIRIFALSASAGTYQFFLQFVNIPISTTDLVLSVTSPSSPISSLTDTAPLPQPFVSCPVGCGPPSFEIVEIVTNCRGRDVQDVFAVLNVQFPPAAQPPFSDRPGCETGAYVLVPFLNVSAITLPQFYSTTAGIEVVLDTNSGDGILYATDPTAALGVNGNVTTLVFEFDNDIVGVLYGIQVRQYIDNLFVTRIVDGNELPSTALFLRQNVPEIICPLPGDTTVCPTTLSACGPVANCDQIGDVTACGDEISCFIDAQENCAQCPTCPVCPDTCTTSPDCAFLNEMDCRTTEECQYSSTTSECTLCSACPPFSCTCPDPVEVSVNYSPDSFEVNVTTQRNAVGTCATENTIFFVVDFEDKLCDDNRYLNRSTQSLGFISQAQEPGCRFVYEWDDNDRELIVLFRFNYSLDATDESDVSIVLNSTFGAMPDCGTFNETFDSGVCALPTVDTLQIGPQVGLTPSVFTIVSFLRYETYSNSCSALSQQYLFNLLDLPGFMVSTPFFDNTSRASIAVTSTLPNYAGDITVNGAPVVLALFVNVEMPGTVITTITHGIVGTDFVMPQTVTDVRAFAYPSTCVPDTFALSLFDTVSNTSGNTAIVDIAVTRNLDIGCGTGVDNEIAFTFETFAEPAEFVAEADPVALTDFAPVESYTFTTSSTQGAFLRETNVSTSLRFRHLGTSVFRIESTVTTLSMAYQVRVGGTIQDTLSVVFTSSETEAQLLAEQARPANPLNDYAAILCDTTYTCALGTTRALCEQRSDVCGTEQTNCCAYFYP